MGFDPTTCALMGGDLSETVEANKEDTNSIFSDNRLPKSAHIQILHKMQ